jgi:hypothetical protein
MIMPFADEESSDSMVVEAMSILAHCFDSCQDRRVSNQSLPVVPAAPGEALRQLGALLQIALPGTGV